MDTKLLEAVLVQLAQTNERLAKLTDDLEQFSERFEEVMTSIENERRVDFYGLND